MKKTLIPLTIVAFVLMSIGFLLSEQNQEDSKFDKFVQTYLDEMWKHYPTAATLAGFHKYDNKLENLSDKNIEKRKGSKKKNLLIFSNIIEFVISICISISKMMRFINNNYFSLISNIINNLRPVTVSTCLSRKISLINNSEW